MKDQSSRTALATHAAAPQVAAVRCASWHEQLAGLHTLMKQLAELAGEKLAAMRRADTAALDRCTAREAELVKTVFGSEARRKALLARVAQSLHLPEPDAASWARSRNVCRSRSASALRARNAALREIAAELQQKNRLAAKVAQNLQSHIRGVFAELATAAQETPVYGPRGQHEGRRPRCWVEAVG